ncbi:prephenate dehydratase [Halalkalibacterium halodurans]|uniref:prephenate dehydratase n=1 Tax=Halalkalibacterium halodurans TaxID=86665 RepID=UPI002AA9FEF8|nr:prephenate dehydratase [Halalkalibacterium halodurans]MDY7221738.1 prephenate dehydratase [Halalkalibacterium halodurans]MDY7241014.1 prephenate dehydratase [Halalkalibacterium halodurans]
MKIGYLGPRGTFTEMAVQTLFDDKNVLKPYRTIPDCMDSVANGDMDAAVVPVENAIEGSVNVTLDYLIHKQRLEIVADIVVPISQHFLVHPNQRDNEIKKILSHPHAVAQCHEFLRSSYPGVEIEYMTSTAAAAQWVADHPNEPVAAIANEQAATSYQLDMLEKDIHDYDENRTRFAVLAKGKLSLPPYQVEPYTKKTTMMVTLSSDFSGALHQVLSAFAWRKLNLTKIESRPMKTGLGNYFFIIDVDYEADDVLIPGVMQELEALGCGVELLGSYPCFFHTSLKLTEASSV